MEGNEAIGILKLLKGNGTAVGLVVVKSEGDGYSCKMSFEGSNKALDASLFEVPQDYLPLKRGDRFFALPIVGQQRWGIVQRISRP